MKLRGIIDNLKIFSQGFNKRPDVDLYFNEKLYTKSQIQNYEKTIEWLEQRLAEKYNDQWEGLPDENQLQLFKEQGINPPKKFRR